LKISDFECFECFEDLGDLKYSSQFGLVDSVDSGDLEGERKRYKMGG